ncbi:MAG TPA: CNP1-like family protein [Burkholderiales bacterium]|nr:CNP1-like family protein [Burkholderiales bacterium]
MKRLAAAACIVAAACGHTEEKSDWEREHEKSLPPSENEVSLPAYPRDRDLIEFSAGPTRDFRYFIDGTSITVGSDGIVRYTLVARSAEGVENVSYEGMRCSTGELRVYALGGERVWRATPGAWRPMQPGSMQPWHRVLYREYFCRYREPVASPEQAIYALRGARR